MQTDYFTDDMMWMSLELAGFDVCSSRLPDDDVPRRLADHLIEDDYRTGIRNYFNEVEVPITDDEVDLLLHELMTRIDAREQMMNMTSAILGALMGVYR